MTLHEPLLQAVHLGCHFVGPGGATVVAVDDVSLSIGRGEALGLVGESGCGKTSLARALLRLVAPSGGRVELFGQDLFGLDAASLRRLRRRAQPVFQESLEALDPRHRAAYAIAEPLRLHAIVPRAEVDAEVERLLLRVGLEASLGARFPHQLSGGQRQRVALARALACRPELLVADEPLSALDAEHRVAIVEVLRRARSEGLALLLISHDLAAVRALCDRVAVMERGRLVEVGPTEELFARPAHPATRALLAAAPPWPPGR